MITLAITVIVKFWRISEFNKRSHTLDEYKYEFTFNCKKEECVAKFVSVVNMFSMTVSDVLH